MPRKDDYEGDEEYDKSPEVKPKIETQIQVVSENQLIYYKLDQVLEGISKILRNLRD